MTSGEPFGQRVRARRRELGLTQEELAHRVGCAPITLRKIEHDDLRPSVQIAERLAMALVIPLEDRAAFVRLARAERAPEPFAPTPVPSPDEIGLADLSGRAIRGYALGERLGEGGMGVVYRATQPLVEREVAVKIILPQYANQPDFIRRFEAEAQLIARLEHPHIVPLYDYWREPGVAYLVMRLLRGGSVRTLLESGALPLETVDRLIEQISQALAAAHRVGVVHRDLKPANILLDEDGNAYLADFGIAKNLGNVDELTQADAIVGSPNYISPEQIRSEFVRPQTDIYCLGVMLYELLTGALPFQGPTPIDVMHSHLTAPLPPLAARRVGLPAALDQVIAQATAKDPLQRYPDVDDMLADWRKALSGAGAVTVPAPAKALTDADNPYKGLRAFGEGDAADFFGRDAITQQLLARLGEGGDLSRFLAVVGPSGCGKSSVVNAGLIPALRRGGLPGSDRWFIVQMVPGVHPLEELEAALLRIAVNPPESLVNQLREDKRGLLRAVSRCLPEDPEVELVLVIDQLEELFTLVPDEAARAHVLDSLVTAVLDERSRMRLVITLRADFIDRPLGYVDFGEMLRQRMEVVLPFTPDELERAITCPAERVGLEWEPGLVAAIMHEVGDQPGGLPLLQYALTGLFEKREGRQLTKAAYQSIGGVLGALGGRAEEVYTSLDRSAQAAARQLFLRLVTLGEGVEDTRRRVLRAELEALNPLTPTPLPPGEGAGVRANLDAFGKARLLAFDRDPVTHGPTVEVAHEALLREWPRLREWLSASRADVRLQRQLAAAALEWQNANRETSFLLAGSRLAQFEGWTATTDLALAQAERTYLDASVVERQTKEQAEAERQRRELETAKKLAETERRHAEEQGRTASRLRVRNRIITAVGGVALLAAVIAVFFAYASNQNLDLARIANTRSAENLEAARVANTQSAQNLNIANQNAAAAQAANTQAVAEADRRATEVAVRTTAQANAVTEAHSRATAEALAIAQKAVAEANFTRADNLRLAAEAGKILADPDGNVETAALLSVRALRSGYLSQADADLVKSAPQLFALQTFQGHTNRIYSAAFSPDGKYVLTGSEDRTAKLWDANTGAEVHTFSGHGDTIYSVAFSPDGKYAVTGSGDQTARLWNVASGAVVRTFAGHVAGVAAVAFSPDGRLIFTGSDDGTAKLWEAATGKEVRSFAAHTGWIASAAFSPDSKYILTGSGDRTVKLWDAATGQEVRSFTEHADEVWGVAFSPDGNYALTASLDGTAQLWETATGAVIRTFQQNGLGLYSAAFSPDGKYALIAGSALTPQLFDVGTGALVRTFSGHLAGVRSVAFSPDGKHALTGGYDGTAKLWDAMLSTTAESAADAIVRTFRGHTASVSSVAFSPDGQYILTGGTTDQTAKLWEAATGAEVRTFAGHVAGVGAVAYSPDGLQVLTGCDDGTAKLWEAATGKELRTFTGHSYWISSVAFSPDGKYALTGSGDNTAKLWDIATGEEVRTFRGHADYVLKVAYSPDGNYVLTGSADNTAKLWEVASGKEVRTLAGHNNWLWGVAFSPDGNYVLTGDWDQTAKLWEVASGEEVRTFTGHTSGIFTVAFSPDSKYILTGSADKMAKLWDVATGAVIRTFSGHADVIYGIAFSPDGKSVLTGSWDKTAKLWDVDYRDTLRQACAHLTRDLMPDERKLYEIADVGATCPER